MRGLIICVVLLALISASLAKRSAPKVQVYSFKRGEYGKPNTLICHANNFYPPLITIRLLKNGEPMDGVKQTELAFEENWNYHMTASVDFTPESGVEYSCNVIHLNSKCFYMWEADV